MSAKRKNTLPSPVVDQKEEQLLKSLTARYEKLIKPGPVKKLGTKVVKSLPEPVKQAGERAKNAITEQELYEAALKVIGTGFGAVQEQAAKFSISADKVVMRVNSTSESEITTLDEICLARCYDVAALVERSRTGNLAAAFVEGAATGAPGFAGVPFNLVLSTFLYFRAVQVVAMSYGYDVKNDAGEMEIAGQVFANSMDPTTKEGGNGTAAIIGKIMMVSEATALKQAAAKTWTDMAARGGVGLLITQMRALANKAAQKALENVGKAGLETSVFRTIFEQIGRRLTLKTVQRAVPVVSGAIGAFFDAGQMQKVVEYADIFYAKRFILEKEARISMLGISDKGHDSVIDGEAVIVAIEDAPPTTTSHDGSMERGAWRVAKKTTATILGNGENAVFSPACIYDGLRVIRLGAGDRTAEELDGLVEKDALDGDWLGLERVDEWSYEEYLARIAAGVWLDEKAIPSDEFTGACERESIPVTVTRLSEPAAGEEITRWISEKTEGLLSPSIDLDPQALACVASALYLKDAWEYEFSRRSTERKPFHADDGDIDADFMVNETELPLEDIESGTLVGYPLSNGAMMLLFLPKKDASLGEIISNGSAVDAMADFTPTLVDVELHLPKFTYETTVDDMVSALKAAGFSSADNPDLIPMTGMGDTPATFIHGAKIAIDENGLEAGAYFAMIACDGALPETWEPPVPRVIVLNRPFAYAVVSRTGQPLFVGVVGKPEADPLSWVPYHADDEKGSENGWITEDEEIPGVCRITLEEDGDTAPYAITCGVYGLMMHTTWEGDYKAAMSKYEGMKKELRQCAELLGDEDFEARAWCEEFTRKW